MLKQSKVFNNKIVSEIRQIVAENPCGFSTIFKHSRKDLGNYIIENTPTLCIGCYKMSTRVYWILNGLTDFPKCKICGKPILRDIAKIGNPQYEYCSKQCIIHELKTDSKKKLSTLNKTVRARYGNPIFKEIEDEFNFWLSVCKSNIFFQFLLAEENAYLISWINSKTPLLKDKKYDLKTKVYWIVHAINTFPKCYNCGKPIIRNVFKLTTGYHQTYLKNHNRIFCSRKCAVSNADVLAEKEKTCLQKYNVKNVSFDSVIRNSGLKPYFYKNIFFDSSLELGYYIWLTDKNIKFEYQPPNKIIPYNTDDGKQHIYHPDFFLITENKLQDIKGLNNFNNTGYPIRNNKYDWHEKYQCMIDNKVEIIMENSDFMNNIMTYCTKKFGKKTWYREYKYDKQLNNIQLFNHKRRKDSKTSPKKKI